MYAEVSEGYRLPMPSGGRCPEGLYLLLLRCWDAEPDKRPTFGDIAEELRSIEPGADDYISMSAAELENTSFAVEDMDDLCKPEESLESPEPSSTAGAASGLYHLASTTLDPSDGLISTSGAADLIGLQVDSMDSMHAVYSVDNVFSATNANNAGLHHCGCSMEERGPCWHC